MCTETKAYLVLLQSSLRRKQHWAIAVEFDCNEWRLGRVQTGDSVTDPSWYQCRSGPNPAFYLNVNEETVKRDTNHCLSITYRTADIGDIKEAQSRWNRGRYVMLNTERFPATIWTHKLEPVDNQDDRELR